MKKFTRQELQAIEERALSFQKSVLNPVWKDAYKQLAMAADRLDAYMARSGDISSTVEGASPTGKESIQ